MIVRATLENELRAVQEWEIQETQKEQQQLQQELAAEKENTQAPADQSDAATEQED